MITKKDAEMLKAYMTAKWMGIAEYHVEGGCETCGHGGDVSYSVDLDGMRNLVDDFIVSSDNVE